MKRTLRDLLEDHLRHRRGLRPLVVHRIDRDTSGLVLFALTRAARDELKAQFERRAPERTYLAILNGRPIPPSGTWRDRLVWDKERLVQKRAHAEEERAKDAEARYRVVEQFDWQALVEVSLVTGKRNQIRVQAGSRGHALVGERQYRFGRPRDEVHEPEFGRQALHAARLAFIHPVSAPARRVQDGSAGGHDTTAAAVARRPRRTTTENTKDTEAPPLRASTAPRLRRGGLREAGPCAHEPDARVTGLVRAWPGLPPGPAGPASKPERRHPNGIPDLCASL